MSITSVHAAAFLLASAGLISRLLGLVRNRLLAAHFGAGRELDIYFAAFQIPDFISTLFLLGAGSAAIVPVFQEYLKKDNNRAHDLISRLHSNFFIISMLFGAIIFFFVPVIIQFMVPGFSDAQRHTTAMLTRIMLLSPILLGLSSILSSVVQSFQRFLAYALAPIFYNIGIIIGIIFFVPLFGIAGLGGGVVLGACMHWSIQWFAITSIGMRPRFLIGDANDGVKKVFRLSLPRVISLSLTQVTVIGLTVLGSTLHAGSISIFELSQDLYFLPIALIGVSYSVVIFPRLHHAFLDKNGTLFYQNLFIGIRTIIFWIAPTITLFIVLRAHIVRVALGAGKFSWEDTRLTAASLAILSLAMIAGCIAPLLIKAFYAIENTWTPLRINIFSSIFSIGSTVLFSYLLRMPTSFTSFVRSLFRITDLASIDTLSLAIGFVAGLILDTILLSFALHRATRVAFHTRILFPSWSICCMILAACFAGIGAYMVRLSFTQAIPLITLLGVLIQGFIAGIVGFLLYILILIVLKNEDVAGIWKTCTRQLITLHVLPRSWDGEM